MVERSTSGPPSTSHVGYASRAARCRGLILCRLKAGFKAVKMALLCLLLYLSPSLFHADISRCVTGFVFDTLIAFCRGLVIQHADRPKDWGGRAFGVGPNFDFTLESLPQIPTTLNFPLGSNHDTQRQVEQSNHAHFVPWQYHLHVSRYISLTARATSWFSCMVYGCKLNESPPSVIVLAFAITKKSDIRLV